MVSVVVVVVVVVVVMGLSLSECMHVCVFFLGGCGGTGGGLGEGAVGEAIAWLSCFVRRTDGAGHLVPAPLDRH